MVTIWTIGSKQSAICQDEAFGDRVLQGPRPTRVGLILGQKNRGSLYVKAELMASSKRADASQSSE